MGYANVLRLGIWTSQLPHYRWSWQQGAASMSCLGLQMEQGRNGKRLLSLSGSIPPSVARSDGILSGRPGCLKVHTTTLKCYLIVSLYWLSYLLLNFLFLVRSNAEGYIFNQVGWCCVANEEIESIE